MDDPSGNSYIERLDNDDSPEPPTKTKMDTFVLGSEQLDSRLSLTKYPRSAELLEQLGFSTETSDSPSEGHEDSEENGTRSSSLL